MWRNGWMNLVKFGTAVSVGPGHIVLGGDSCSTPKRGHSSPPLFGPCLSWPNGEWVKMPLGMEVGLGPGDIVLDEDPTAAPKGAQQPPLFGTCRLWVTPKTPIDQNSHD